MPRVSLDDDVKKSLDSLFVKRGQPWRAVKTRRKVIVIKSAEELQAICPANTAIDFSRYCILFAWVEAPMTNDAIASSHLYSCKHEYAYRFRVTVLSEEMGPTAA